MSPSGDDERPPADGGENAADGVGSVGQEAAKLFTALSDWAREQQDPHEQPQARPEGPEGPERFDRPETPPRSAGAEARDSPLGMVGGLFRDLDEHLATGAPECRYCPVCQVVHLVRQTSPEVRAHLSSAASSLMQAAAGLLATQVPPPGQRPRGPGAPGQGPSGASGIERIDLEGGDAEDDSWDEDR